LGRELITRTWFSGPGPGPGDPPPAEPEGKYDGAAVIVGGWDSGIVDAAG